MPDPERFEYTSEGSQTGEAALLPQLPLILTYKNQSVEAAGLLDTGATVNVLPYRLGLRLGAQWDPESPAITLTGNLAHFDARPIVVEGSVGKFPSVRLAFAWTRSEDVPLILGQVNFFMEFDVCFYRSRRAFDVRPKG